VDALTDFFKNAGLLTLLHLLITAILVLIATRWSFSIQRNSIMWWWLPIGIVPAVSGILLWYFINHTVDTAIREMSHFIVPDDVPVIRREARLDLMFGLAGTTVILLLRSWRQKLSRKSA
jgi:hypothetical protein